RLIIGTEGGIFLSDNAGERWQDISSSLKSKKVKCAALINGSMYACTDDGLYVSKTEPAGAWERIYVISRVEEASAGSEIADAAVGGTAPEEVDIGRMVNCVTNKGGRLYIGVGKAILYSDDAGRSWAALSSTGLAGSVNYIKVLPKSGRISCATTKGVYLLEDGNGADGNAAGWRQVYKGTDKVFNANSIVYEDGNEKSMWAITDNGLYKLEWSPESEVKYVDVEKNVKSMSISYDNEPSFKELQMAAMDFAEVDPVKISEWRKQARMRALLPKLSVGIDHGRSTNNEIYTSATSRYVIAGPDDLDDGWDLSVSWELGDLIWSDDQTGIDVRSRLTTQLRNDILDDLRRDLQVDETPVRV
ncbi:MAG TPA: hypothetical protein PLV52_07725, partial [Candidatus Omnitrophota bacterium]|nr:hypothetical protein [Candidatus Omnitrophota bacterium]